MRSLNGLAVACAAEMLSVTRAALSALLNERTHLSSEIALRLEKVFGVSMDTLMRMQNSFDIAETRKRAGDIKVKPYQAKDAMPGGGHLRGSNAT